MRWALASGILLIAMMGLGGCQNWVEKAPQKVGQMLDRGPSITLEEYLGQQRELGEQYLYGSPMEALKALEALAKLEEEYAVNGQRPVDSDHARMLAYSRLFVLSEKLRQRPEAEGYLEKALEYAKRWRPELGAMTIERQIDFVRRYVDEFEKGLEVRWKEELK